MNLKSILSLVGTACLVVFVLSGCSADLTSPPAAETSAAPATESSSATEPTGTELFSREKVVKQGETISGAEYEMTLGEVEFDSRVSISPSSVHTARSGWAYCLVPATFKNLTERTVQFPEVCGDVWLGYMEQFSWEGSAESEKDSGVPPLTTQAVGLFIEVPEEVENSGAATVSFNLYGQEFSYVVR